MPQNPDIHATGWEVWKRWTFACSVALVIGVPFGFGLGAIPVGWIDPDPIGYLIGAAVFGVVVGTTLGIGQRIVLSRVLPVAAPRWTRMTVAGALGGCVASPFVIVAAVGLQIAEVSFWVIVPLSGAVMGATIGLAQRFALPPFFPRGWWVLGSSVSWCLGVSLFAIGCSLLENVVAAVVGSGNVGEGTVGLAFILVAPVVNGALSGAPWLVFRRSASTSCLSCGYDLTGIGGDICPECGQQRAGSGATRAWRPGKRALWSGILGFVIAFIGVMFLTEGGRSFVLGVSGWGTHSAFLLVVKSLGAGVIVGTIACFIGGAVDNKRG